MLAQIMAWHLFSAKPLSEPMLNCCQFEAIRTNLNKLFTEVQTFLSRKSLMYLKMLHAKAAVLSKPNVLRGRKPLLKSHNHCYIYTVHKGRHANLHHKWCLITLTLTAMACTTLTVVTGVSLTKLELRLLFRAWISNLILKKAWDAIADPCLLTLWDG